MVRVIMRRMNATQTRQLWNIVTSQHRHIYRLALHLGAVIAQCDCGKVLTAAMIEAALNVG
jgi:hypothetical protein